MKREREERDERQIENVWKKSERLDKQGLW